MPRRIYVDSGVLMAAWNGDHECYEAAKAVLEDPDLELVASQYVAFETIPKPHSRKETAEVAFLRRTLAGFDEVIPSSKAISDRAVEIAGEYSIFSLDAFHVAAALVSAVDEIVTTEKATKPMFRVRGVQCRSIWPELDPAAPAVAAGDPPGPK